jgi:hypothetical protein
MVFLCLYAVLGANGPYGLAATDVLFLVDTTGSMSGIGNIKTAFSSILNALAHSPCPQVIRYSVADYRNYTDGGNYTAYGVNLVQPFTSSTQETWSAINGLVSGEGGDTPESQLKAMVSIADNWLTTSGDLGFNGRGSARKIIIWAGDAPGHIAGDEPGSSGPPPDGYYPVLDEVIDALTVQGILVFALNSTDCNHGLNEPYDGINNNIPPERQQAGEITTATGGMLFCNVGSGSSEIGDAVVEAVQCTSLGKEDDLNDVNPFDCRSPGQELKYTLCWDNAFGLPLKDITIIDWLPVGVNLPSAVPQGTYDPNERAYYWEIGDVDPNTSGCVELTVVVNEQAPPGQYLRNIADLWGTVYDANEVPHYTRLARVTKNTLVCCWDTSGILYVDQHASGAESGLNWDNAFTDLQDALAMARQRRCVQPYAIYVAQGTYYPGESAEDTFQIPQGVFVYGGFPAGGCPFNQRNPKKYETILTGLFDEDGFPDVDTVVTMGDQTRLEGFTVTSGLYYNIYGDGADFSITHCVIKDSFDYGIYAKGGNIAIQWSTINSNFSDGIRHEGDGFMLTVDNCWLLRNGEYGIQSLKSTLIAKNSIVSESDLKEAGLAGIHLYQPTFPPVLHNLTISNNKSFGIAFSDDGDVMGDPNYPDYPDVQNCIVYYNNSSGPQLAGFDADTSAFYCCIQDCNEVNNNYNDAPGFAYPIDPAGTPNPDNYRLSSAAFCIDKGNPALFYVHQADMDKQPRVAGLAVDIGAYEVHCDGNLHPLDQNADGIVNYEEFTVFSHAWLSRDPNDPAIITDPNYIGHPDYADPQTLAQWETAWFPWGKMNDFNEDLRLNLDDLIVFSEESYGIWLWEACWRMADCGDGFNALDYDGDGLVNMVEFGLLSSVWQSYQPASPIWQFCNLDNRGDSAYLIDMADLIVFMDHWLWVACWRAEEFPTPQEMQVAQEPNETPTNLEMALQLQESVCFLEDLWENDPNMPQQFDPNDWQQFMDTLYAQLDDLVDSLTEIELMGYYLLGGGNCGDQQRMRSGGGDDLYMESESAFAEPLEENPYAEMSIRRLVPLVKGLYSMLEDTDKALAEDQENRENWLEIKDFLEGILNDIRVKTVNP